MNCSQARSYLGSYLDSDLEASTTVQVNQHLDACPACRQRFTAEQKIESAVAQELRAEVEGDDEVATWVLARATRGSRQRWRALLGAVAIAALALLALWLFADRPPVFVQAAAVDHQKFLRGALQPDLATGAPAEVQAYLARELGIDAPLLSPLDNWRILGPRTCVLKNVTVGLVLLERGAVPVSLFFLRAADAQRLDASLAPGGAGTPRSFRVAEGHAVLAEADGLFRCAVGQVPIEDLRHLVLARRE